MLKIRRITNTAIKKALPTRELLFVLKIMPGALPDWHLIIEQPDPEIKSLARSFSVCGFVHKKGRRRYLVMTTSKDFNHLGYVQTLKAALALYRLKNG